MICWWTWKTDCILAPSCSEASVIDAHNIFYWNNWCNYPKQTLFWQNIPPPSDCSVLWCICFILSFVSDLKSIRTNSKGWKIGLFVCTGDPAYRLCIICDIKFGQRITNRSLTSFGLSPRTEARCCKICGKILPTWPCSAAGGTDKVSSCLTILFLSEISGEQSGKCGIGDDWVRIDDSLSMLTWSYFPPPLSAPGRSSTLGNMCDCTNIWDKAALQELPNCSSWGTLLQ